MNFKLSCLWATPTFALPRELDTYREVCRYSEGSLIYKSGAIRLGAFPHVKLALERRGVPVVVEDTREPVPPRADLEDWLGSTELREDQKEALRVAVAKEYGIVKCPTSYGKGTLAAAMCGAYPQSKCLLIAPDMALVNDFAARVTRVIGEPCGVVGDGKWTEARVTAGTIRSLYLNRYEPRGIKLLSSVEVFLSDECHSLAGPNASEVASLTPRARIRIGFSATPTHRADNNNFRVIEAVGPLRHEVKASVMLAAGIAAKPVIRIVPCLQPSSGEPWPKSYESGIVRSPIRNGLVVHIAKTSPQPVLVSVNNIEHGKILKEALQQAGLTATYIDGSTPTEARRLAVEQLAEGKVQVLVASKVVNQGQVSDKISCIRTVINAAGFQATIPAIQRVGRGMRRTEGKDSVLFYDFDDKGDAVLKSHSTNRRLSYLRVGYSVTDWPMVIPRTT